jgi:hypothetical protein
MRIQWVVFMPRTRNLEEAFRHHPLSEHGGRENQSFLEEKSDSFPVSLAFSFSTSSS